jgi:metallo-beta-lactamase family protein
LGRLLVNGVEKIKLFRQWIAVKAQIHTLGGFSAHAGQRHLLDWTDAFNDSARIYLVHGEPESMQALVKAMAKHLKRKAVIPEKGQVITF